MEFFSTSCRNPIMNDIISFGISGVEFSEFVLAWLVSESRKNIWPTQNESCYWNFFFDRELIEKDQLRFHSFFCEMSTTGKKIREDFLINLSKAGNNQVFDATYLKLLKQIRSGLVSLLKDLPLIHTRQLIHTTTQIVHIIYKFNTNWWNKCTLTEISEEKILCRHQDLSLLHSNLLLLARALNLLKRTLNLSDWTLWPYW